MAHSSAQPNFDIGGMIQKSWQVVQRNGAVLIGGIVVIMILEIIANGLLAVVGLPGIAHLIIGGPLQLAYYAIALRAVRGESSEFPALFDGFNRFLPAFLANLALFVAGFGWLLCLVPGFLAYMVLCLIFFYMHDRKQDAIPAIQSSYQTVTAAFGAWAILYLAFIGLNVAGALLCGVGLLISIPVSVVMLALAYEQVGDSSVNVAPEQGDYQA